MYSQINVRYTQKPLKRYIEQHHAYRSWPVYLAYAALYVVVIAVVCRVVYLILIGDAVTYSMKCDYCRIDSPHRHS